MALDNNYTGLTKLKDWWGKVKANFTYLDERIKANFTYLDERIKANFTYLDERISTIITTPAEGVSAQEIIDARKGETTLGDKIDAMDAAHASHLADNVHYHVRTATVVVAAYDSKYKQFADFVSSGGDDSLLIVEAINALPENGGKIVLLDGTYNISTMLQIIRRNIWLAGCGVNTILKVSSDFRPEGLRMMVSDMVIDFDGDNSTLLISYGNSQILTRLTIKNSTVANILRVDNITVDNCKFENNFTHLRIDNSNALITNCRFSDYNGGGEGLYIYTSAVDTIVTNCYIDALNDTGTNTVVANNIIREV